MFEKMVGWPKWAKFLVMWAFGFVLTAACMSLLMIPYHIWVMIGNALGYVVAFGILPFITGGLFLVGHLFPEFNKETHRDF
jgi:hypothetical protein